MAATEQSVQTAAVVKSNETRRSRDWAGTKNTASSASSGDDPTPATTQTSVASTMKKETLALEGTTKSKAVVV